MAEQYDMPANHDDLFAQGAVQYIVVDYSQEMYMDNVLSMAWFIEAVDIPEECIVENEGTQIIVSHPKYKHRLVIDAGGLGDFNSHRFDVAWEEEADDR